MPKRQKFSAKNVFQLFSLLRSNSDPSPINSNRNVLTDSRENKSLSFADISSSVYVDFSLFEENFRMLEFQSTIELCREDKQTIGFQSQ